MILKKKYLKEVVPAMKVKFGYKNDRIVPKIEKVTVNIGLSRTITEKNPKYAEIAGETIVKITGQRPVRNLARKSIAGFKVRQGMLVGLSVTLRSAKMYDFLEKLIRVALPRTRDFRGIPLKSVDGQGNLSIGFKEQIVFPEITPENVQKSHGFQVVITTSTRDREKGLTLLELIGFPFRKE